MPRFSRLKILAADSTEVCRCLAKYLKASFGSQPLNLAGEGDMGPKAYCTNAHGGNALVCLVHHPTGKIMYLSQAKLFTNQTSTNNQSEGWGVMLP
jgi:hypothetical protein